MKKNPLIIEIASLMEDIDKNSEGLDKTVLLQALLLTDDDFSKPMTAEEIFQEWKEMGII